MTIQSSAVEIKERLTAIIADDEPVARRLLRHNLDRFAPHVEIVGEASNGQELLLLLEHTSADMLMLDIVMPGLDGLEALALFREKAIQIEVIIISAYGRFDFAQKALKLGAFDFLLKPVRPADLVACIDKCAAKIVSTRNINRSYADLERKVKVTENVAKTSLLREVVSGVFPLGDEVDSWNGLQFFDGDSPQLMVVVDVPGSVDDEVVDVIAGWCKMREAVWCESGKDRVVMLLKVNTDLSTIGSQFGWEKWAEAIVKSLNDQICAHLSQYHTGFPRIGYIGPTDGLGLARRYEIVCRAINRAYSSGKAVIKANSHEIPVSSMLQGQCEYENQILVIQTELVNEVRFGSLEAAKALLEEWVQRLLHLDYGYGFLRLEFATLINSVCRAGVEVTGRIHNFQAIRNTMVEELTQISTLDGMVGVVRSCLELVFNAFKTTGFVQDKLVSRAKAIVEKRFYEDLTLGQVASEVFVSQYYLSRLFKKQCGVGFQQYLMQIRIREAKNLLRNTDLSCAVVGEKVGYSNASYFSRIFGKVVGQSPTEFRQMFLDQ